jgi:hypothetical protein
MTNFIHLLTYANKAMMENESVTREAEALRPTY